MLRFTRVVERGRLKRFKFCGSDEGPDSPFGRVLARVIELGGRWECVFSSCWTIYLPADCAYDPNAALRELERAPRAGGAAPRDAV